ncbi:MAG TPA: glycosyltransferase [Gaiellaceae bacterium]|nr:glycosyltransferase [Gaiellaceae bacterium]
MSGGLTYSVVTPVRNEESNLPRLAESLVAQTVRPAEWLIVDNGSSDSTPVLAAELAERHDWIAVLNVPGAESAARGGPIVRAFTAGLRELRGTSDLVVKLDADLSFAPDHFERLLREFSDDPKLGIASGVCWEEERGEWRPQFTTRGHVRGAERAYRRACLDDVLPLEERMGWDGVDEVKAAVNGWRTASFKELPVMHHRALGGREDRVGKWIAQGDMAHFMGYRPSYLVLRAVYRALKEPSALLMMWGYARAVFLGLPRLDDERAREWLRREQGARRLGRRAREALGRD